MSKTTLLIMRETKRSFGILRGAVALLLLEPPFLGRQRITIESGFWTKVRDDMEVFRIRDIVPAHTIWQRLVGIGDIVVKSVEGRSPEEVHVLKGVPDPVAVSEAIRNVWNKSRPRGPAVTVD